MKKEPVITNTELQAEYAKLDLMRNQRNKEVDLLTDEQFNLIHYGRNGSVLVKWNDIYKYWKSRNWGEININTLQSRYRIELQRRNLG